MHSIHPCLLIAKSKLVCLMKILKLTVQFALLHPSNAVPAFRFTGRGENYVKILDFYRGRYYNNLQTNHYKNAIFWYYFTLCGGQFDSLKSGSSGRHRLVRPRPGDTSMILMITYLKSRDSKD